MNQLGAKFITRTMTIHSQSRYK